MLIDVPLKEEFLEYIEFTNDKDVLIKQSVLYEWQPIKCRHYHMYGHLEDQCRKKQAARKVWRVKQPCLASDPPRSTPQTIADAEGFTSVPSKGTARSSPRHIGDLDHPHKSNSFSTLTTVEDTHVSMDAQLGDSSNG